MSYEDRQRALEELIQRLMQKEIGEESELDEAVEGLRAIYLDETGRCGFRHRYSQISSLMLDANSANEKRPDPYLNNPMQILASNMDMILDAVAKESNSILERMVTKLHDHVNLELLRINYNAILNQEQDVRLGMLKEQIANQEKSLSITYEKTNAETKRLDSKLQTSQKDSIAILAIFAAVIMAFSGGFSFTAGSIDALGSAPVSELLCLVSFVGLVLIDLFYLLFRFIWQLVRTSEGVAAFVSNKAVIAINALLMAVCITSFLMANCMGAN